MPSDRLGVAKNYIPARRSGSIARESIWCVAAEVLQDRLNTLDLDVSREQEMLVKLVRCFLRLPISSRDKPAATTGNISAS